ncbi:MAG: cytochrome-c peroxidase [Kofleriaceae bacterium]
MTRRAMALVAAVLAAGCTDDGAHGDDAEPQPLPLRTPILPATPPSYDPVLPAHVQASIGPGVDNTPVDNPITDAGALLGRVLFHDRLLSANQTTSCASCHRLDAGVADDVAASSGFDGGLTARASMPAVEVRFYARGRMFWDERAATLEEQVLLPIQNEVEMGLTVPELVARVAGAAYYAPLFDAASGSRGDRRRHRDGAGPVRAIDQRVVEPLG